MIRCQALVDQLGLFSNNEDADDLATAGWAFNQDSVRDALLADTTNYQTGIWCSSLQI